MEILEKRELDSMILFSNYINMRTCPTSFALATGLLDYSNGGMICASYFVNDTSETNYSHIMKVSDLGIYSYASKMDKFGIGLRPSITFGSNTDMLLGTQIVNKDISVIKYGYYPKSLIERQTSKEDTGIKIKLSVADSQLSKSNYKEFTVYRNGDIYFIMYPICKTDRIENIDFIAGMLGTFKIEPVRFWVDNNTGLTISQDIIQAGVAYLLEADEYKYDDYYESDLFEATQVIDENMRILTSLIKEQSKQKKKRKK